MTDSVTASDTLADVMNAVDPELFKQCFMDWVESLRDGDPDIISVDGKTSRRSHDRPKDRKPLHLVSAWASRQRLVLGQQATEEKSNEIPAIPLLLERLVLKGAIVTIDAPCGTHAFGMGGRKPRLPRRSSKRKATTAWR